MYSQDSMKRPFTRNQRGYHSGLRSHRRKRLPEPQYDMNGKEKDTDTRIRAHIASKCRTYKDKPGGDAFELTRKTFHALREKQGIRRHPSLKPQGEKINCSRIKGPKDPVHHVNTTSSSAKKSSSMRRTDLACPHAATHPCNKTKTCSHQKCASHIMSTPEINNSIHPSAVKNTDPDTGDVTVTSLTAKTFDPRQATATVIKNQEGLLYSLWRVVLFLFFEALGLNKSSNHKGIHEDYEHANLDKVASRGKFPYRPSDLFLKVQLKLIRGLIL